MLDELLHELSRIANEQDLVMVGSQTIQAITDDVPVEVVMSRECDLLLDESDPLTSAIDQRLADVAVVRDRIAAVSDLHMRAVLAARLQIVLEGASR